MKTLKFVWRPIYVHQSYRFYRKDIVNASGIPKDDSNITYTILKADDSVYILQIEAMVEFLKGKLFDKIDKGDICLVALKGDFVAGFNLIAFGTVFIPLINKSRTFRNGTAWSEHIAVHKDFRKMGLASQLRNRIFDELNARGIHCLYGGTLPTNFAAIGLANKMGFKMLADAEYHRFLFWKWWVYKRIKT